MSRLLLSFACILTVSLPALGGDPLVIGGVDFDEVFRLGTGEVLDSDDDIYIVNRGTLLVEGGILNQTGQIYVLDDAGFVIDSGEFHLSGNDTNIWVGNRGHFVVKNGAFLHYVQQYVAQHNIIGWGDARIELEDSEVDCDGSIEFIYLVERAAYSASRMTYNHWKTWYLWDDTALTLTDVNIAGDVVFYDRPTLRFTNTTLVMPWLYLGDGATVDSRFPQPEPASAPVTLLIEDGVEGFAGIGWSLSIDNCRYVAWGINPYPGSQVSIRDSALTMVLFRFLGRGEGSVDGIMRNGAFYDDQVIPADDRFLRLVNTSVAFWKVDVDEEFDLTARDIVFSEMMVKNDAKARVIDSVCEGQTIHLGVQHRAELVFEGGEVWSYVSAWDDAVMVLESSVVDWQMGRFIYQTRNIAHGHSRLYCVNSWLRSPPEAFDAALVLFVSVDRMTAVDPDHLEVRGSAWIDAGPSNPASFIRYRLEFKKEDGETWSLIEESSRPVDDDVLGYWDIAALPAGHYTLRLTAWSTDEDSSNPTHDFPAMRTVTLPLNPPPRRPSGRVP